MSFIIYKTFPKTLKFTSAYTHYSLGSSAIDVQYIYTDTEGFLRYNTSSSGPNTGIDFSGFEVDNSAGLYKVKSNGSAQSMQTVAFSSGNNNTGISTSQKFYVSSDADKIELTESNLNAPTSLVVQETYPQSRDYSLLDGSFVTYKSNTKHRITVGFEYLPKATLDLIIALSKSTVIIVPELEGTNVVSPYQNKAYVCNWEGSSLDFRYSNPYKKAGYTGQISFKEV